MPNFLIYNLSDPVDLQRNIDLQKTFDLNDEHYIFYDYLLGVISFLYPKAYWKKPEGIPTIILGRG